MKIINVGLEGLEQKDFLHMKSLVRLFRASSSDHELRIVESRNCDIVVVNMDSDIGVRASENASKIVVGAYSNVVPDSLKYTVKKPFIGRRVINVFKQIAVKEFPIAPPKAANHSRRSKLKRRESENSQGNSELSAIRELPGLHSDSSHSALVVDDSEVVRNALKILLKAKNFDVTSVNDGAAALKLIGGKRYFDVVFLDIVMPKIDGYKVCKELKKMGHLKNSKVVMLTSKSSKFDRIKASLVGCDHYLTKPISKQDFIGFVDGFLAKKKKNDYTKKWCIQSYGGGAQELESYTEQ
jgi:CheY-like chemotaxis protein